mmetsp:Transcript_1038/g.3974  ORF Transcript_1038/g.3974 Transcript_1038/m.3974 type:complete len:273 (-) Transcript_1038:976-1794(-)
MQRLMSITSTSPPKGGRSVTVSHMSTPKLNTSWARSFCKAKAVSAAVGGAARGVCPPRRWSRRWRRAFLDTHTSGARYCIVVANLLVLVACSATLRTLERPKSLIMARVRDWSSRMLSGLRSRCAIGWRVCCSACKKASPDAMSVSRAMRLVRGRVTGSSVESSRDRSEPPAAKSRTSPYARGRPLLLTPWSSAMSPMNCSTAGWWMLQAIRISLTSCSSISRWSSSSAVTVLSCFTTTLVPGMCSSSASMTTPKPPSPSFRPSRTTLGSMR